MAMKSRTQRILLFTFIGSIALCGLIGIYTLLTGNFGALEGMILGSTASAGGAAILALAAAIPTEKRRWHPIGPIGIAAALAALVMLLILIWVDAWRSELFVKALGCVLVLAVAFPHVGLLSLARLRKSFEWIRALTILAIALLATLIISIICFKLHESDDLWRGMGTLAILSVCGTIAVPVLHRVSAIRDENAIQTTALVLTLTCPRCSSSQTLPAGRSKCASCGLRFNIEIEEEHCPKCGYAIYKLTSANCPECGTPVAQPTASPA